MDDLSYLPEHLQQIIDGLSDGELNRLKRQIATKLRQNQSKRIAAQQNADGSSYAPRKVQQTLPGRRPRRVRRMMMAKLKNISNMRIEHNGAGFSIAYGGRMAGIASVHQFGLTSTVSAKRGTSAVYPVRELLGISDDDKQMIDEMVVEFVESVFNG